MKTNLVLDHLTAKPGEKISGYMKIINTDLEIPVTLICGTQEGPAVLVTAGPKLHRGVKSTWMSI